ncbi:MAG: transcriptional regulator NrdR [Dehalococcoidia bacterium]
MRCPYCGNNDSRVTDSRESDSGIRRRRECRSCGVRFTTYERVQSTALMVSKQDNRREEFNREKLIVGIRKACAKRPVSSRTVEKVVEDIEAELQHLGQGEVPSSILGEMVMDRLRNLDRVAYIRYASVYRDFQDIESFELAVKDLREGNTQLSLPQMTSGANRRRRRRTPRPMLPHRPPDPVPEGNNHHTGSPGITGGESIDE